ncbi:hypothetical protein [Streptomyces coeruleorubidus]|uniref:Uncharacterized protein n=1 Tax=Streptomyces coeruleorubidus TaxID=116188 RepID=A0A5J6IHE6_STRC4|nr:hypothetical protein [Streptomyces coeruleorubidus]QEV30043.1 hypothetical protein CP976_42275 [Streptomyces coeruleorubidus]GGU05926.1 hypothetical protein GCM10010256_77340 [Streptomyces coeruleorubidus]
MNSVACGGSLATDREDGHVLGLPRQRRPWVSFRHSFCAGRIGGAITDGAIAGTVAYDKWSKRRAAAEAAPETTTEAASSQRPLAPGPAQ